MVVFLAALVAVLTAGSFFVIFSYGFLDDDDEAEACARTRR